VRSTEPLARWILVALAAAGLTGCADLQLLIANVAVANGAFRETRNVAYGSDRQQQLDIYRPPGSSAANDAPRPVVVFFHGGSWSADSKNEYKFVGVALAEQGWIGVVPNFRQYPQVRFPAFVDDAARAIAWVHDNVARYGGDPARIVLMGHSSGAHIAMLAALDKRYLAADGIDANEIRGVIGLSGAYDFLPLEAGRVQQVFEGVADPLDTQPVHFARADAPPILLLHGSADTMVAASNSTSLATALGSVGARFQLKIYDGRNHADLAAAFSRLSRDPPPVLADVGAFVAAVAAGN
jgi:acetyl esterase/lipase